MLSFYVVVPREERLFFSCALTYFNKYSERSQKKNKTLSKAVQGVTAVRMKCLAHMTDGLVHAGKP